MTLPALFALIQDAAQSAAQAPTATPGATPPAADAPAAAGGGLASSFMSFFPLIAIFAIFYFVLIAPERKNRKRREEMLKQLAKGDKVLTTAGMYGTVVAIQDNVVTLQLDEGVRVRFSRASIQEVQRESSSSAPAKH